MGNVNPGLINPYANLIGKVPFLYQIMTIGGLPPINKPWFNPGWHYIIYWVAFKSLPYFIPDGFTAENELPRLCQDFAKTLPRLCQDFATVITYLGKINY